MSIFRDTEGRCTGCGKIQRFKLYRSINVAENPELKAGVRDGSLFVWECPECGRRNLARYESLYHDPEAKLMIWLLPGGEVSQSQMDSIGNHTRAMGNYTLRRVSDVSSLIEKLLIFDAGLDDVVVEMCKYVTRAEMASKAGEEQAAELLRLPMHFYRLEEKDGERYIALSFPDNGRMVGCNIGWNVYEDCRAILERNPSVHPEEGFAKVDAEWLMTLLQ